MTPLDQRLAQDQHASPLTDHEAALLDFERTWWALGTAKDDAIRERFAMTPTDYHRALSDLIDRPEALAHDAVLVRRLRRRRTVRRLERSARRSPRS